MLLHYYHLFQEDNFMKKEITHRYDTQIALAEIGKEGQRLLQNAKVLVIGAGGLGCPVLQQLVSAGVGTISIIDGDVVEESNLHRQILYCAEDCGKGKAKTAYEKLLQLNPEVTINYFNEFFTEKNAHAITDNFHIIVDCTDTIKARYLINDIALAKNIPVVYASIHKFEGQVSVFNYKNGPSYRCLFPENESKIAIPNCVTSGVLGILPNTLGMLQATEVLKIILGIGKVLSGKVLVYDALASEFQKIEFSKKESEINKGLKKGLTLITNKISDDLENLSSNQFLQKVDTLNCLIVDIRARDEMPRLTFENRVEIPLENLENASGNFNKNQEIVLCCQTGKRSMYAKESLKQNGFTKVYHLKNGINSLGPLFK